MADSAAYQGTEPAPQVDPLVLGITRPATIWGVSYPLFVVSAVATAVAFLASDRLIALGVCIPLHAAGYVLCRRDTRRIEILLRRFRLCPPVRNRGHWRCNSYEPA